MRLRADCRIISLRGRYLLSTGEKTLEVNQSFARIWEMASKGSFTSGSLAGRIIEEYDIGEDDAAREAGSLIGMWKEYGLLEDSD